METKETKEKDFWDKVDIVLRPINGILTALAVALLGYYTSSILRQSELRQTNERVYTELMSSRELAESGLRKDMFLSIIQTFLRSDTADLEAKMLNPERRDLTIELGVRTPKESANIQRRTFHVGYYDFPMIDNTRLSSDQRAAVVLNQMNEAGADITLVFFPGSYASLREKVSYDEV